MRAIMTAVDYSDILQISLPYNRKHFTEVAVVTSTADAPNVRPIAEPLGVQVIVTDLFYQPGAKFAKWAALEYGLDVFGRRGFLCVMDADVLWPKSLEVWADAEWVGFDYARDKPAFVVRAGQLCTPLRRMADPIPKEIPPEELWCRFPLHRQQHEWAGYSHVFNAEDPALGPPPWYDVSWATCAGADSLFQRKWAASHKVRPPWEVLHLGPAGTNWVGRASPYVDGTVPPDAEQKKAELRRLIRSRGRGPDRYAAERIQP